jgi:hypothetical protein
MLNSEFREKLFHHALEKEGSEASVGRRLGYQVAKGRRFRELRDGITKTMSLHQLKKLSEITDIPIDEILKHAHSYACKRCTGTRTTVYITQHTERKFCNYEEFK